MQDLLPENYVDGFKRLVLLARKARGSSQCDSPESASDELDFKKNICTVCGYTWKCRPGSKPPAHCPACRSSLWNVDGLFRHTCSNCGHKWVGRTEKPTRCPSCRSKNWSEKKRKYQCADCGHTLEVSAEVQVSDRCPVCDSANWGFDYVRCVCKRCGYAGYFKPDRPGRCPMCKATVYTGKSVDRTGQADNLGRVEMTPEIADILSKVGSVSDMQVTSYLLDLGVSYEDAGVMIGYMKGSSEVEIARTMDIAYGTVRMITSSLSSMGIQRT